MDSVFYEIPTANNNENAENGIITGVMVCVTGQRSCERLINRGFERTEKGQKLFIVHCVQTGHNFMNSPFEADAIEYLFTAARLVGAELTILREDDVINALVKFANDNNVKLIVLGASPDSGTESFVNRFAMRLPEVEFDVVRTSALPYNNINKSDNKN